MSMLRHSINLAGRKRGRATLLAAILAAACLWPGAGATQSPDALEAWMESALTAAAGALAAEEERLDELAARNSRVTLPGGGPSSGQAAANIRLWDNAIREREEEAAQLRARLGDALERLGPEIASHARRLSPVLDRRSSTAGESSGELAARIEQALDAARNALAAEEGRLDELAARNSGATLPGGGPSSGQAAASTRLWDHAIREREAEEARFRTRLGDELERLGPEIASLVNRLNEDEEPDPRSETPPNGRWTGDAVGAIGSRPEAVACGKGEPLRRESSVLFRRILSLPGAVLLPRPDAADSAQAEDVTTFSVFYVYDVRTVDGETWLCVGRSIQRGSEGWIAAGQTEEWRNMLVMQFPDRVNRGRVPFFDDERNVRTLLDSFRRERDVRALYERLERGDAGAIDGLVAVEPAEAIAGDARPYLMPILDWRPNVVILDTGDIATLVQVAGINAAGEEKGPTTNGDDLSELNIGIAFVIDTTRSMGPYIRTAREIVVDFAREIEREGVGHFVDFALVGYRDNTGPNPGIEYVSRIYRDFGGIGDVAALENELAQARVSPASTQDWREDAFAGLRTAIEELSWSPRLAARVIVLITDAGARSGSDPLASNPRYDTLNVLDDARRRNIAIVPIHLLTPQSERGDDTARAGRQYRDVSTTAEGSNYIALALGDEQVYRAEMQAMVANLRELITRLSRDEAIDAIGVDETLPESTRAVLDAFAADASSGGGEGEPAQKPRLAAIVQNQIFRAQLQYLGRERGTSLPPFYRAWAADLDLADPRYQALDVRVFLTRNQLNELAQVLDRLLDEARRSGTSAQELMDSLQHLSAAMTADPNMRTVGAGDDGTLGDLLPGFLRELPYRSNIFDLGLRDFANASIQAETVEQLGYKLEQYRRINGDTVGWLDLGSGDPGEFVYPIQLRLLP